MFLWMAAKPGQDASMSGGPFHSSIAGQTSRYRRQSRIVLDKIKIIGLHIHVNRNRFRSAPGPQTGGERLWLLETSLDCNLSRESERKKIFLAFFGHNPLKSPDSEN